MSVIYTLSGFEDKESHRSIFLLLYSPGFLFPNLQFPGGFCSTHDTMSAFLVTFLFKQSKGGHNLAHYPSLWAVCFCLITLAQTRTFFFFFSKMKITVPACPFFLFLIYCRFQPQTLASETFATFRTLPTIKWATLCQKMQPPPLGLCPCWLLASGNDIYSAHWNVTLRTEPYKLLLCSCYIVQIKVRSKLRFIHTHDAFLKVGRKTTGSFSFSTRHWAFFFKKK